MRAKEYFIKGEKKMDWTKENIITTDKKEPHVSKRKAAYEVYKTHRQNTITGGIGIVAAFLILAFQRSSLGFGTTFIASIILVILISMSIKRMNHLNDKYKLGFKPIKPPQQKMQKMFK